MRPTARPPLDPGSIRAVAFDAYGTLFRFHDDEFRLAVTEILATQRLDHPDHEQVYRTFYDSHGKAGPWRDRPGDGTRPDRERMLSGPPPPWESQWEIWSRQWAITFAQHDLDGDAEAAANYLRDALAVADAYPDAHDTIERLAASGLRLGLLSDADDDFLMSTVSRTRLRFSVIQSSESLRAYKPHRAPFLALARHLGCETGEVLYVGDSPPRDVGGAGAAGMRTAWVRRSERQYPEQVARPDVEVTSLAAIADLFEAS